jgi:hypothetical protein
MTPTAPVKASHPCAFVEILFLEARMGYSKSLDLWRLGWMAGCFEARGPLGLVLELATLYCGVA